MRAITGKCGYDARFKPCPAEKVSMHASNVSTVELVADDTGCNHTQLANSRVVDSKLFAHCIDCLRQVAIETDQNRLRTGRTWLVKHAILGSV